MKNKRNIRKVFLDTTFLLPTLGIDVGNDYKWHLIHPKASRRARQLGLYTVASYEK